MLSFVSLLTKQKTIKFVNIARVFSRYDSFSLEMKNDLNFFYENRRMSSDSGILRTPDSAFVNLYDYPFKENYIELSNPGSIGNGKSGLRLHYLDEGDQTSSETILLLHGEPTWSYLYRHFIPLLKKYRVIVPDFIGFGKSDKPAKKSDYTYQRHVNWIRQFLEDLNLTNLTLFCQVNSIVYRMIKTFFFLIKGLGKFNWFTISWNRWSWSSI